MNRNVLMYKGLWQCYSYTIINLFLFFFKYINNDTPHASIYICVILTANVVPSLWEFEFIFLWGILIGYNEFFTVLVWYCSNIVPIYYIAIY